MNQEDQEARQGWRHEDELINQRLTWLLSAHALVGAGYAWLRYRVADITLECVGRDIQPKELAPAVLKYIDQLESLMNFLAYIGLFVSVLVGVGLVAACVAQNRIKKEHSSTRLGVSRATTNLGRCAALSLPSALLGAYAYMLMPVSCGWVGLFVVAPVVAIALNFSLEKAPKLSANGGS